MVTGDLRNQVDRLWDAFWSGRHRQPPRSDRADHLSPLHQAARRPPDSRREQGPRHQEADGPAHLSRWERRPFPRPTPVSRNCAGPASSTLPRPSMFEVVGEHVFPFLRTLGGESSTYAAHMKDARFTIPRPACWRGWSRLIDQIPMEDRDTKGDLYEYMLGKIATAGQNGQFRTPRHIIRLMVEMAPTPKDAICDPACGTAGFLMRAGEYLREHHPEILPGRQAPHALPHRSVPRLRFRQHHAPHRQHEHAAARRREPGHPLSRLARPGPCRRRGEIHAGAGQSALRRLARLRELPPRTCRPSSRQRRPSCYSWRSSCAC